MISKMPTVCTIYGVTLTNEENLICKVFHGGALIGTIFQNDVSTLPRFSGFVLGPVDTFIGNHWSFDSALKTITDIGRFYAPPF